MLRQNDDYNLALTKVRLIDLITAMTFGVRLLLCLMFLLLAFLKLIKSRIMIGLY